MCIMGASVVLVWHLMFGLDTHLLRLGYCELLGSKGC